MMLDIHPLRVLAKALVIFAVLNVTYAALDPHVGRLSIYNWLVPGRQRLPRGGPAAAHNLAPEDLDAAFAAHIISASWKDPAEYRVLVLGDSSVWGPLLHPSETLVGQLNDAHLSACGKQVRFFNLGYPGPSALRDFVVLSKGRQYQPDLVLWMLTLNSFKMRAPPPVWGSESREAISVVLHEYGLDRYRMYIGTPPTFLQRTLVGQRRRLARLAVLQADGLLWDATGIDQSEFSYAPVAQQLVEVPSSIPNDPVAAPNLDPTAFTFDIVAAAHHMMGAVPVLIVSEPIYLATPANLKNPRGAIDLRRRYDQYRALLQNTAAEAGLSSLDLTALVPPSEFTNAVYHLTPSGEQKVARALSREILSIACP